MEILICQVKHINNRVEYNNKLKNDNGMNFNKMRKRNIEQQCARWSLAVRRRRRWREVAVHLTASGMVRKVFCFCLCLCVSVSSLSFFVFVFVFVFVSAHLTACGTVRKVYSAWRRWGRRKQSAMGVSLSLTPTGRE